MKLNIFAPKASRVLGVLLVKLREDWKGEGNWPGKANVSHELVHFVFKKLLEMKLATRDEQNRFVLTDPLDLLKKMGFLQSLRSGQQVFSLFHNREANRPVHWETCWS